MNILRIFQIKKKSKAEQGYDEYLESLKNNSK